MRIGIDVGGTHTDAVILDGDEIVASTKALTSADVISGVSEALDIVLGTDGVRDEDVDIIMIGTTQFTNAVVQRRDLEPTAAIRIGLPSGRGLAPMLDWPGDIRALTGDHHYMLEGGFLYDGRVLAELDEAGARKAVLDIRDRGLRNIAIASAFSPVNREPEQAVLAMVRELMPDARVTLSSEFGRLGLVERENAAILNAMLLPLADRVVESFLGAIANRRLSCPVFISQNDGTLMSADFVRRYPALTFSSGPTNSLRGACRLTGLEEAIVIDIGGTTSDVGVIQQGFPRESSVIVDIGGVRTNFRMPDVLPIGLGGGSLVRDDGQHIGPDSVGHQLVTEGRVFGGQTLTATDILVAGTGMNIGDPSLVADLDRDLVNRANATMLKMLDDAVDSMKPSGKPMPVILVGGGAILVNGSLEAASEIHKPDYADVANAIGAAIAQIGGEAERLMSYRAQSRDEAVDAVKAEAAQRAVAAGADSSTIRVSDIEETPVPYMSEGSTRVRVKVIGDIDMTRHGASLGSG